MTNPVHPPARMPNFLHLGPGKSGSTWLHEVLSQHPELHLSPAKDLYFFSRFYDRGPKWYADQFTGAAANITILGEVCPDYLAHPEAATRIRSTLGPKVQLMVTLRDPVDRAFSSYLYLAKHGLAQSTFRDTWRANPELLDEGKYADQLARYQAAGFSAPVRISLFDDLQQDPQAFLDGTTHWLGVSPVPLPEADLAAKLPASAARLLPLAKAAQRGAEWVRRHDGAEFVGRIKRSPVVQRLLYRPLGEDRPTPSAEDVSALRAEFSDQILRVEGEFAVNLHQRWGWQ